MKPIKKIRTIAAFVLITFPLLAQNVTKPFNFPHKTGDMWEYFYYDGPMSVDTLQNFIISDTVDPRGIIHLKQHAISINPKGPAWFFYPDTVKLWIDTVNNYVLGREMQSDSVLIYKLYAQKGEQWTIKDYLIQGGNGYEIARIKNKWNGSIFGKTTTFMQINFYYAQHTNDTTGLDRYYDTIADGIGLVSRGGGDLSGQINLIGAVIDGKLYGDTTLVSIDDNKNLLPTTIKLYQNYPNPFNPSTTIKYSVPVETGYIPSLQHIALKVYDVLGREIVTLVNEEKAPGNYEIRFNVETLHATSLPSGVYFYTLSANGFSQSKKMLLAK